jgi:hypothetical protein
LDETLRVGNELYTESVNPILDLEEQETADWRKAIPCLFTASVQSANKAPTSADQVKVAPPM